jgi:Ca2+-binding EF-hand superfamily protein
VAEKFDDQYREFYNRNTDDEKYFRENGGNHDLDELFALVDANMDGQIDGYEYLAFLYQQPENKGRPLDSLIAIARDALKKCDRIGNGILDFEEFINTPIAISGLKADYL